MRSPVAMLLIGAAAFALAACTANEVETSPAIADNAHAAHGSQDPAPGGVTRRGDSFAMMSEQYTPRAGPFAATGASAWVRTSPPPAFVASGPAPAADPPAPPPAAVANRQPAASATPAPASEIARPEAAAPEAPAATAPNPALRTAGLALFNTFSCSTCHALADANASGSIGPSLDRNARLTKAFAVEVISNGSGAMPSFAGQMSNAELATLADYIVAFSRK